VPGYCLQWPLPTSSVPIIGPVQEKETSARVKAIKKMLSAPEVLSALSSILLVHFEGRTISNPPKKAMAKTTSSAKKIRLKSALVATVVQGACAEYPRNQ